MTDRDLALTFAGGGNRAFYQLGLLHRWAGRLMPRVAAVAACSAGACVFVLHASGRERETGEFWRDRRSHVTKNFEWSNVLHGRSPAPHGPVYRDTLLFALADGGFERVRALPFPLLVLASAFPRAVPAAVAVAVGIGAYQAEKLVRRTMVHPAFGRALGFRPFVVDARACEAPEMLADLVIASSATPPFTPVGRYLTRRLLDGGLVDNVPAFVAEEHTGVRRNLVLLTRQYPAAAVGARGTRLYVVPSEPVPVSRWDYTRPELLDATVALGERDADRHSEALERFLSEPV